MGHRPYSPLAPLTAFAWEQGSDWPVRHLSDTNKSCVPLSFSNAPSAKNEGPGTGSKQGLARWRGEEALLLSVQLGRSMDEKGDSLKNKKKKKRLNGSTGNASMVRVDIDGSEA